MSGLRQQELDRITVVIPTKNEAGTLELMVNRVREQGYRILVVDGHSTDETRDICKRLDVPVILDRKRGKGDAIRCAIDFLPASGIVVFMDADGSHDPIDIIKLVRPILAGEAQHVHGSRMLGGSDELHGKLYDVIKLFGSEIITLGINYRFGVILTDCQNGFRALDLTLAKKLDLKEDITTIEQEMVIKTLHLGEKILEAPTHEYRRLMGESKISLKKVFFRYIYSWLKNLVIASGPRATK